MGGPDRKLRPKNRLMGNIFTIKSVALFAALFIFSQPALGHAGLVRSAPANGEVLTASPEKVELEFSARLQSGMNSIAVTDGAGKRYDTGEVYISADGKIISVSVADIRAGKYRVEWRALSADDHTIKGEYSFELSVSSETQPVATPEGNPPSESEHDHSKMDHGTVADPGVNWPQSLIRWLMYMAMMSIFGCFAFRIFVLAPVLSSSGLIAGISQIDGFSRRLAFAAFPLLLVSAAAALILQTAGVFDVLVADSFDAGMLERVLFETSFGLPWLLQIAAAAAAALTLAFLSKRTGRRQTAMAWAGLAFSAALFLTPSLTGHARAAASDYPFTVVIDWLHLIGAGVWVGGLLHLAVVLPAIARLSAETGKPLLGALIARFTLIAIAATILLSLTGLYNTWIHVESLSALISTDYGIALLVKLALIVPMIILGGLNAFVIRPRIDRHAGNFDRSVKLELALGAAVLLLAAILAFLPPAREHPNANAAISARHRDSPASKTPA